MKKTLIALVGMASLALASTAAMAVQVDVGLNKAELVAIGGGSGDMKLNGGDSGSIQAALPDGNGITKQQPAFAGYLKFDQGVALKPSATVADRNDKKRYVPAALHGEKIPRVAPQPGLASGIPTLWKPEAVIAKKADDKRPIHTVAGGKGVALQPGTGAFASAMTT
jgi:opacity protein-like surface antigen